MKLIRLVLTIALCVAGRAILDRPTQAGSVCDALCQSLVGPYGWCKGCFPIQNAPPGSVYCGQCMCTHENCS